MERTPDDVSWFSKFYLGDAGGAGRRTFSFSSMQLWRMSVELRQAVRVVHFKDASDKPADYYL